MNVTGSVLLDLTDVAPNRQRHRVAVLDSVPDGARVVLVVGALTCAPESVRLIREHVARLHVDVQGAPRAVQLWVAALRTGKLAGRLL